ncbi:MAG: hypothetical protein VKJ46_11285 [Leptolyngbyaceae bacterium]|nr:hypothetical protein [Leptolyngbyaceae bacterium]
MIAQQVSDAIAHNMNRPEFFPERQAISKTGGGDDVLNQVSTLLQSYAPKFESQSGSES